MSSTRHARLDRIRTMLGRAGRDDEVAAIRVAVRNPAGAPTEHIAALAIRIRMMLHMTMVLDGIDADEVPQLLARDNIHLSPVELEEARQSLRRYSVG
jgi:hypothetical protein